MGNRSWWGGGGGWGRGGGQGQTQAIPGVESAIDGGSQMVQAGLRPAPGRAASTSSTALPASLQQLVNAGQASPSGGLPPQNFSGINMQALQMQPTGTVASNPNYPVLDFRMQPTYADGGAVGMAPPMGAQPVSADIMQGEAARIAQSNPQVVQQIQQSIAQALQSGELTMDQLNMAVQMALAAAQNPELYPRLRQLAIQRGLATEEELPMQYDQGIVFAIIMAAQAMQGMGGDMGGGMGMGMGAPTGYARGGNVETFDDYRRPSFRNGGYMPQSASPTGDNTGRRDDINIRVSGGEYIIPKHIVERKGTEFFDKLIGKS